MPERERPKLSINKRGPTRSRPLILSIALHVVLFIVLATITFSYPIGQLIGLRKEREQPPERLQYIVLPRGDAVGNGSSTSRAKPARGAPAPLRAPTVVPPAVQPATPETTSGAVSGKEGGVGGGTIGAATGVEPAEPDPRIQLVPGPYSPIPKTAAERTDSAVKAAFGIYYDSARYALEHPQRAPGDWTKTTKDGEKWGWDPGGIRLGKYTIPNAILAALPLKMGNGRSPVDMRTVGWQTRDIADHAQTALTEDDFRAAVRRIRERKERERRDRDKTTVAAETKGSGR